MSSGVGGGCNVADALFQTKHWRWLITALAKLEARVEKHDLPREGENLKPAGTFYKVMGLKSL